MQSFKGPVIKQLSVAVAVRGRGRGLEPFLHNGFAQQIFKKENIKIGISLKVITSSNDQSDQAFQIGHFVFTELMNKLI